MASKKSSGKAALRHRVDGSLVTLQPGDGGAVTAPRIVGDVVVWAGDAGVVGLAKNDDRRLFAITYDSLRGYKVVPGRVALFAAGAERVVVAGEAQWVPAGKQWWRFLWIDAHTGAETKAIECADVSAACVSRDRLIVITRRVGDDEMLSRPVSTAEGTVWEDAPLRELYAGVEGGFFGDGDALIFSLADGAPIGRIPVAPPGVVNRAHGLGEHVALELYDDQTGAPSVSAHRISDGALAWRRDGSTAAVGGDFVVVREGAALVCVGEDGAERWRLDCHPEARVEVTAAGGAVALVGDRATEGPALSFKEAIALSRPIELRDAASGEVLWSLAGGVNRVAASDASSLWAHTPKNELVRLALASGAEQGLVTEKDAQSVAVAGDVCAFYKTKRKACELLVYALPAS